MLSCACLASGGLDSIVCMTLMRRQNIEFLPIFVNYGQINLEKELRSLRNYCAREGIREPVIINISGFGSVVKSGLTSPDLDVNYDAFTPNRNLLLLTLAASVAFQHNTYRLVMGLLSESTAIFPDQTDDFLAAARDTISRSLGTDFDIVLPLRQFTKADVVRLADHLKVEQYYSCHSGTNEPCGRCIACMEYD